MSNHISDLISRYYDHISFGQAALEERIRQAIERGRLRALDAGCGHDAPLTKKYGANAFVVGLDLESNLPKDVPAVCGDLAHLPFGDGAFDLIFSRSVFEHLPEPDQVLKEFHRVLTPGGWVVLLTPNRYDYSSVVAHCTPQWFHKWFVERVYNSGAYDTFPTLYRANTPGFFEKYVEKHGGWRLQTLDGLRHYPCNLMFSRTLFRLGVLYDWLIARAGLKALQPSLLIVLEKSAC